MVMKHEAWQWLTGSDWKLHMARSNIRSKLERQNTKRGDQTQNRVRNSRSHLENQTMVVKDTHTEWLATKFREKHWHSFQSMESKSVENQGSPGAIHCQKTCRRSKWHHGIWWLWRERRWSVIVVAQGTHIACKDYGLRSNVILL